MNTSIVSSRASLHLAMLLALSALPSVALAQAAAAPAAVTPQQLARYDQNKNGVLDGDELAALRADEAKVAGAVTTKASDAPVAPGNTEVLELSPFVVNTDKDNGFMATNAGTATKLGLDMKDMSAPYSVMTGEFLKALDITDLQQAALWSTNGTPVLDGQGADLFGGAGTSSASVMYNIRGAILNVGQQRNFFLTSGLSDTYNIERIDFGRGPNGVLFNVGANDALGGGISTQGKRAQLGRDAETLSVAAGSWDFYRGTLDVNHIVIPDKFAVRANLMYQKSNGWMQQEFEDRKGLTLAGTYRIGPKSEVRVEAIWDKTTRSRVPLPYFDNLSGWNGSTVFNGPITNDMYNGLAPLTGGTALARGPSSPTNSTIIGYQGQPEGVWRENNNVYVYDPASNTVMNWIHTGSTRRGDETPLTPLYINGVAWSRNNNSELLPLGNGGSSGGNSRTPGVTSNGGAAAFYDMINLPAGLYARQIANSHFTVPNKRFSAMPSDPLFVQPTTDFNLAFTHQVGESMFFELAADANRVREHSIAGHLGFRTAYIDINRTLPNGSPNPHFLDPYSQSDIAYNDRRLDNWGIRASLGYIKDLGKWGHYTFNLSGNYSGREVLYFRRVLSIGTAADPREWHAGGLRIRPRYYWNDSVRPYESTAPTSLFDRVPSADGNSYTTTTTTIKPRWVLDDWSDRKETTKSGIFAFAGRYFNNKLVISPGIRVDQQTAYQRVKPTSWGFIPVNANWDGATLADNYWRPDAPKDWLTLSYIPKNADGSPRSAQAVPAFGNRPTIGGVNDVNPAAPQYANDRFRGDYNNPKAKVNVVTKNMGATYHVFRWMSLHANYGEGYKPADPARFSLYGDVAKPEMGVAYEGGITFSLFGGKLTVTPRYYFNRKENRLGDPPTTGSINNLMGRRAWDEQNPDGRNKFGYGNVLGGDYFATKNNGTEVEINSAITRGWRVSASYGTGQLIDYDRWNASKAYVQSRKGEMLDVLKAAGGTLDTAQKPFNAGHSVNDAPGLAIADPAVTSAMITAAGGNPTTRNDAVNDYNNIWIQYDNIGLLQPTIGIRRMSAKIVTDYTFQQGRLKGLRLGLRWMYVDKDLAGYRSADTVANPNFNSALPVTATNRPWMDDASVDLNTPIWVKRPSEISGTIGYSMRLKSWASILQGKEVNFQLNIRNLTNAQDVFYQDDGVVARPPNADPSVPYRTSVPGRIASFQRPISYQFTTTLKF